MRLRPTRSLFSGFLLAVCLANELIAQTTTSGGLTGVVTDPSSAVVPDAAVEIKDSSKGTIQATKTDRAGVYRFFFLAPGRYTLMVAHVGFREEQRRVDVLLGPSGVVNVALEIAKANTTVSVTDEAPLIRAENGDVSTTMNQKQISEVPNPGNDLTYIAQTAPGAVMETDYQSGANFSILGMPGTSYLYTMDGMNDNWNGQNISWSGALFLLLGQNQIQEATVVTTGYSGQFGGAAGGNVNYITKSGSNELHGNAQYYWNGRALNANDWILNAFGKPRPFDNANQWAGSLGGPIKRDKLFFFFDAEGLRLLIAQLNLVQIPSPQFETATIANIDSDPRFGPTSATAGFYRRIFSVYNGAPGARAATPGSFADPLGCGLFTSPNGLGTKIPCALHFLATRSRASGDTLTSGRVDWNMAKNDRAFLRLQYDRGRNAWVTDPISAVFDADYNQPWWQGQFVETHTFNASGANQFLVAGSYITSIFRLKNPSLGLSTFPAVLNFNVPGTYSTLGGQDNSLAISSGGYFGQYQLSDDFVKTSGNQKFGFGGNFARIHWSVFPNRSATTGVLAPQTLDAFYQGGLDPVTPSADFTSLAQSFTSQNSLLRLSFLNFGLYSQDEWHARPNLTLTLALRAEHYDSNPVCRSRCFARLAGPFDSISHDPNQPYNQAILINQKQALLKSDKILWSPRFSFAWQPLGVSHKTILRGGAGVFYDPVPGNIFFSFLSNPPLFNSYTIVGDNLTPNEKTSLFKDAAASNAAFVNGFAAGQTLAQIQSTISSFYPPGFSAPGVIAAARTLHAPQYQRWSLELQQAFNAGTSLTVGYFGHHGIHELAQNPNANAFGFGSLPPGVCGSPPVLPCADPRFSGVTQFNADAVSNYNGMVVSIQHRFSGWSEGQLQANYTYGHAFDEVSNGGLFTFAQGGSLYPQDPHNLRGSYGPAEYDVRHSFNASYVWEVPAKAILRGHGYDSLVKGWQVSGTIFARAGFPYTIFDFAESSQLVQNNYFGPLYAVPAGPLGSGLPCGEGAAIPFAPHPCQPPQVLPNGKPNPSALFVQTRCETGFNAGNLPGPSGPCSGPAVAFAQGRNRFRGPTYFNTDFAIMKNTKIPGRENVLLGIGFQFFNFFNHPNLGFPDNYSSSPTFGQIFYLQQPPTSILGAGLGGDVAARMIQLKVQLQF
jgi:hypothetical protein